MHPLDPFLSGWAEPPYHTTDFRRSRFLWDGRVVVVKSRLSFGQNRLGRANKYIHRVRSVAGVIRDGRMEFALRFYCLRRATDDLVLQADPGSLEVCPRCEDRRAGPAVYRIRDLDGRLLYVGATAELCTRLRQHERTKPWWGEAAKADVERYADMDSALAAEVAAILAESPKYNERAIGRRVYAGFVPIPVIGSSPVQIDLPTRWAS